MVINMNCKNCGSELRSGATFCTNCGTKIEAEQEQETPQEQEQEQEQNQEQTDTPQESQQQKEQSQQPLPVQNMHPQGQFPPQNNRFSQQPIGFVQTPQKNYNTGLIIGISVGAVVLIIASFFIGLVIGIGIGTEIAKDEQRPNNNPVTINTPTPDPTPQLTPEPTPQPDDSTNPVPPASLIELAAYWERVSGDYLWFFGMADRVEMHDNNDGTLIITVLDTDDWGIGRINNAGNLIIEAEWGSEYEYTFFIVGDTLTISDIDGDTAIFKRVE